MRNALTMPRFWRPGPTGVDFLLSVLLAPAGWIYAGLVYCRLAMSRPRTVKPVLICIGNAVVGGSGKTPTCLALGKHALKKGLVIHYLTRGYGGNETGPMRVDPTRHDAASVGDEALLLASVAPTWVAKDRSAGAVQAAAAGAELIVMDDGLQNPSIRKTYTLLTIDGTFGFGNGLPMPAGPLREFRGCALARSNRCLIIGPTDDALLTKLEGSLPLSRADIQPATDLAPLKDQNIVAFAGIGHPEKFFKMLRNAGLQVSDAVGFSDHHVYSETDLEKLQSIAESHRAMLVTTTKDYVRLPTGFRANVQAIDVGLHFTDQSDWGEILDEAMAHG